MDEVELKPVDGGWQARFFAMGSPCEILLEAASQDTAEQLARLAESEAHRIEEKFSRYIDGNIVARINSADGQPSIVDDETSRLIDFAVTLYELSEGRFDITSGALRRVWRFDGASDVPEDTAVKQVLEAVGWQRVTWDSPQITMLPGMEIDFGGIGKEYAVDRVAGLLAANFDGSGLVNFGGDLAVSRPPVNKSHWSVGIESPGSDGTAATTVVKLRRGALATSGDSRRFVEVEGVRYGHILDPTTGWPVLGAPRSVTVAEDTCVQAGMLSTLAMLEGEDTERFLDAQGVHYWCYR